MSKQLPLALRWPADQRFDSFVPGDNGVAVASARAAATERDAPWLYFSGATGTGKTHLLIAACAAAIEVGRSAQYLNLANLTTAPEVALRGCGGSDVLAIDDIGAVAGDAAVEHALFDLYNSSRGDGATLLFAAAAASTNIGIQLPDLVSRLSACNQFVLRPLDEASRRTALRARANARGIELDDAALDWLFTRQARDLGALTRLLDRIDRAALAAQRRVTVPFLRELLAEPPGDK